MNIAAYQPFSLSDFPGKMTAVVFTQGCNFRCSYCHNPALLPFTGSSSAAVEEVLQFLEKRKGKLQGLVITGGEPTLQTGLIPFIKRVKELGCEVKLDTNGSRPGVLEELLKTGLINYAAMDIKAPLEKYAEVARVPIQQDRITRSIRLLMESGIAYEFRTTVAKNLLSPRDILACGEWIKGAAKYILQPVNADVRLSPDTDGKRTITYTQEEFSEMRNRLESMGISCQVR
jgi:pyruvate formate lyase activating enzyme